MTPELHAIAQYSALRIVDSLAEGTVIGIFAAMLLRLARHQSAGTRFAIWFSALIAIPVLPLVSRSFAAQVGLPAVTSRAAIMLPDSWALYLFAAWAIIAGWFLLGVGRALWHLHVLRKNCTLVDPVSLDPVLQDTLRRAGSKRQVAVCTSEQVRVPTAIGLLQPAIVLPRWVMQELSTSELNQIFLHELAHLRRWDDWTNFAQQIVRAIFFFHPAVWWIESKVALEREIACDDAVLEETSSPRAYAECLAHLAERSFLQRTAALAQAAIGRIRQTSSRVARILDGNRPQGSSHTWKPAVALVGGFAIACGAFAARAPRLIAFEETQPPLVARSSSAQIPSTEITPEQELPAYVHVTPAKFVLGSAPRRTRSRKPAVVHPEILRPKNGRMFHLVSAQSAAIPVPLIETVFVLVQGADQNSPQVYQLQMWRVTLLRYVVEPVSKETPSKKT
jgi:beta-lactamase regulating signal transducer with metallopeptidase domain